MYHIEHGQPEEHGAPADPADVPFPETSGQPLSTFADGFAGRSERPDLRRLPASAEDVLDALDDMSRRIDHLARELHCLGWFDDDDDRPRAA